MIVRAAVSFLLLFGVGEADGYTASCADGSTWDLVEAATPAIPTGAKIFAALSLPRVGATPAPSRVHQRDNSPSKPIRASVTSRGRLLPSTDYRHRNSRAGPYHAPVLGVCSIPRPPPRSA